MWVEKKLLKKNNPNKSVKKKTIWNLEPGKSAHIKTGASMTSMNGLPGNKHMMINIMTARSQDQIMLNFSKERMATINCDGT